MELIAKIFTALIPPRVLTGEKGYRWSTTVALVLFIQGVVIVAQILLVWGFLPFLFAGFEHKSDLIDQLAMNQQHFEQTVKQASDELKASMLQARIYNYRMAQCSAIKIGNGAAAQSLNQQIEQARTFYMKITGDQYELRPCSDFGL